MKIKVHYEKRDYSLEVKQKATVFDILKKLGINPEMVIVSKNGKFVTGAETVKLKDKIDVLKVVSGG